VAGLALVIFWAKVPFFFHASHCELIHLWASPVTRPGEEGTVHAAVVQPLSTIPLTFKEGPSPDVEAKPHHKPRVVWTEELHQRFLRALDSVGSDDAAVPTVLLRVCCRSHMRPGYAFWYMFLLCVSCIFWT
jgi:SHAQKYF class myb-like DNA-binding protein